MKIDCSKTENYFKEKMRMTKRDKNGCDIECIDCPYDLDTQIIQLCEVEGCSNYETCKKCWNRNYEDSIKNEQP